MFEQVNQIIEVSASFRDGKLIPQKLIWSGREIMITQVNLSHHVWEGRSKIYYFAVSDSVNDYKLRFDSDKLTWDLLEVYAEWTFA